MIQDKININSLKGWLTVNLIDRKGFRVNIINCHNALTADAKEILLQNLAGVATWPIELIKALKASSVLASSPTVTYTFPTSNSVQFTALFDEASFNDTLDELQLFSGAGDAFSSVTGLSILKDNTLQLEVIWKITIP